jgi:rhamnogalacturonyl hydrolase YesR
MKKEEQSFGCGISMSQKGHALSGWILRIVPLFAMLFTTVAAKAAGDGDGVKFNPGVRYSQWAINSRAHDFKANTKDSGLAKYKVDGTSVVKVEDRFKPTDLKNDKLDYVPGLVAKSMIEAADYYQNFDWSKPWFASVKDYGDDFFSKVANTGGSLDDLNAVKLYIGIYNYKNASATDKENAQTAIGRATEGLKAHNNSYSIQSGTLAGDAVVGGWFHKAAYNNQMWLDGAYMGSALLAQIVNFNGNGSNVFGSANDDWNMVFKQLNIVWNMCWNSTDKLMYHAFEANAGTGTSKSHADTWAGLNGTTKPYTFHSAAYWGRANAWYIFALVDALEAMGKAGRTSDANYTTLRNHLQELAAGIVARQTSDGGWYQLLDKTDSFKATSYNGKSASATNYIETSATAIFSAALFKAARLGLIDAKYKENAKKAFECLVNNYTYLKDGSLEIWGSCRSAGLGGGTGTDYAKGGKKYRDGSNEYYLLGYDVPMVKKSEGITEGKVLGGFIMAATEYERAYQNQDNASQILFSYDLKPAYDLTQSGATAPKVEVCGTGAANATYQWYDANTDAAVKGATEAQFIPQTTGNYYCKATVDNTSIQTSATNIKVNSNSSADKQKFTVTATAENGTVEIKDGNDNVVKSGTQVEEGTKLIFTAKANTGYVFGSWEATGGKADGNVYTISSLNADANVTANFIKENTGGGETVETTLFSMEINSSPASLTVAQKTDNKPTLEQLTSDHAAITGGTVTLVNNRSKDWTPFSNASITVSDISKNYIRINLGKPLDAGDVINIKDNSKVFKLLAEASSSNSVSTSNGSYTLDANSVLKGKNEIFVFWSAQSNPLSSITITRKTTTPTTSPLVIAVENVEMNVTDEETRQPEVKVYGTADKLLTLGSDYTLSFSTDNNNVTINDKGVFTAAGSKSNYTEGVTNVTVTATPSAELAGQYTEATENFTFTVRKGKDDPAKYRVKAPGSGVTYSPMTPFFNGDKTLAVTLGGWIFTDRDTAPVSKEGLTYGDKNKWADDSSKATWVIKGFDYYLPGLTCQNARQEDGACPLPSETQWYDGKLQKVKGGTVDPMFYVPCSGAYLTVEPKTNGKVSVSVFQNGVFDKSGGVYAYRPQRRVFVLDEAGKVVASEATISATGGKLSVADKSATGDLKDPYKITNYPCNITGLASGPSTTGGGKDSNPSPKVEEVMKHFRGMTSFVMTEAGFQNNVYESNIDNKATWGENATPNNGADDNVMGSHGWSVLVDAAVTYTFDVKAGKTYYIYNYGSKLGFYGFSFDEAKGQTVTNYEFNDDATNTIELTKAGELAKAKVNRAMTAGVWTTCVLPFSLNKQQVDVIFGKTYDRYTPNGTQILYFDRVEGTKAIFVRHAYNNIVAGKPFLIKPTKNVASINTADVEAYPYVTIENTKPAEWCKGNGYVWMASYSNDLTVKEGDCFISNKDGSFKNFVGDPGTLKGFRGYLKNIGTNGVSEAKKLTVGMGSNVTTDETSAIDGILIDGDMPADSVTAADGKVYNLNGQVVATSYRQFQALPGGVYVVNGKKVVK